MVNRTIISLAFILLITQAFSQKSANSEILLSDSNKTRYAEASALSGNNESSGFFKNIHGFIGTSWSHTLPKGEFQDIVEYGTQMRFMDFGFFFSKNIGISGLWHGGSNYDRPELNKIFYSDGILAGPILSLPLHERLTVNARALAGYAKNRRVSHHNWRKTSNSSAYMFSFMVRYEVVNDVGLYAEVAHYKSNFEYTYKESVFEAQTHTMTEIKTYTIGIGISYLIPELF